MGKEVRVDEERRLEPNAEPAQVRAADCYTVTIERADFAALLMCASCLRQGVQRSGPYVHLKHYQWMAVFTGATWEKMFLYDPETLGKACARVHRLEMALGPGGVVRLVQEIGPAINRGHPSQTRRRASRRLAWLMLTAGVLTFIAGQMNAEAVASKSTIGTVGFSMASGILAGYLFVAAILRLCRSQEPPRA